MRHFSIALAALTMALTLSIAGCGKKGDLEAPPSQQDQEESAILAP